MLCHYLTDSFTGSHDETRQMSLVSHKQYEYRLHDLFAKNWKKLQVRPTEELVQISERIAQMHREYETAKKDVETDCRMIIEAVRSVMAAMAGGEVRGKK